MNYCIGANGRGEAKALFVERKGDANRFSARRDWRISGQNGNVFWQQQSVLAP
jgi:hypothetical protein